MRFMRFTELGSRPKFERAGESHEIRTVVYRCSAEVSEDCREPVSDIEFARRKHAPRRASTEDLDAA